MAPQTQVHFITSQEGLRSAMLDVLTELNLIERQFQPEALKRPATRSEAANFLGISLPTLDTLLKTGQISYFLIGRQIRINWTDIEAYVKKKEAY